MKVIQEMPRVHSILYLRYYLFYYLSSLKTWSVMGDNVTNRKTTSYQSSGEVYSIQHYVIKFISDLRQYYGFWVSSVNKTYRHDITEIFLKVTLNTINPINQTSGTPETVINGQPYITNLNNTSHSSSKPQTAMTDSITVGSNINYIRSNSIQNVIS